MLQDFEKAIVPTTRSPHVVYVKLAYGWVEAFDLRSLAALPSAALAIPAI